MGSELQDKNTATELPKLFGVKKENLPCQFQTIKDCIKLLIREE